jgi:hypothetical protein
VLREEKDLVLLLNNNNKRIKMQNWLVAVEHNQKTAAERDQHRQQRAAADFCDDIVSSSA